MPPVDAPRRSDREQQLRQPTAIRYGWVGSPLGDLFVATNERGLCWLAMARSEEDVLAELHRDWPTATLVRDQDAIREAIEQLEQYFAGRRTSFDLPVDLSRLTPFQRQVLEEVARIPHGRTRTYAEVARAVGRPLACRAVGNAVGRNPVSIVVPCHRVLGAGGRLGGYGYGLEYKRALLRLEGVAVPGGRER